MWSPIVFCLIVGVALASNTPAWKENKEYIYKVHGRALAGLEIANEYSGILLKASLRIQTRPDGKLQGMIVNPQYAQIHSELSDGWMTYIPDHELSWKPLEMSRKPFQIDMKHGNIADLIVNRGVPNWEANMIKGIMSQFQMNLSEANTRTSRDNNLEDSAFFRVYEETVSGNTDTFYQVNRMPEYMLLNSEVPDFEKMQEDDDQVLEITKHKNYTDNIELPSYFYGFGHSDGGESATNTMGNFFLRNTMTRALVTGSLKQFTIQQTRTINEILVRPTIGNNQMGAVYTSWNTTLEQVKSQEKLIEDLASPVRQGGLSYAYGKPYAKNNEAQERKAINQQNYRAALQRLSPSLISQYEASEYKQDKPQLNQAPEIPFLAYTVGNKGRSIKSDVDVVQSVVAMSKEIGEDLNDPRKTLHENIAGKFITLINLLRTMDESELRQASKELYALSQDQSKHAAWDTFRDAVPEAGHGPALLLIQSWIEVKNIQHHEASYIISTMAKRVQLPTTQYMKTFFELIKKPVVAADWPLNETAALSFSELVHNVYFERKYFKSRFPVNSFENLWEKEGLNFVRDSVIPYFTEQLDKAVLQAETSKIHLYIRVLGNIGSPEVLKAYKPYLEGQKTCSQFQRTLMIMSMEYLAQAYPEKVRPVLVSIYKNNGEVTPVRVSAVFQIMHTRPEVETLQYMASNTKIDADEQVNAAVKSSIETAANFKGNENKKLAKAAHLAKYLLTDKEYGIQYGANFLESYIVDELNLHYKEITQLWGSDWRYTPNGIRYVLKSGEGGLIKEVANVQALFTSLKQFSYTTLTEKYAQEKQQKQQSGESQKHPWSSENIAKVLNMKSQGHEDFEGNVILNALYTSNRMLSFNNNTLRQLANSFEKLEERLRNGEEIDIVKLFNRDHMVMAVPNEMGLPFVFSYNAPLFFKLQGKIQAASNPQVSQNSRIHAPEHIQAKWDICLTVGSKVAGHISFITPFDNQQYVSGFEKNLGVHLPVSGKVELNFKKNDVQIEIEPKKTHPGSHVFHYSTWPFVARKNILDLKTISAQNHNQIIKPESIRKSSQVFGKKATGLAIQVDMEHDRNSIVMSDIGVFCKNGLGSGLRHLWNDAQIQYSQFNMSYLPEQSTAEKIALRLGYQQEYKKQGAEKSINWQDVSGADELATRQQNLMDGAASGITNVKTHAIEASVNFQGEKNIEYIASGAYASSNVDAKSRVYAIFKKNGQNGKSSEMKLEAINEVPNTISMDLQEILNSEPKAHSILKIRFDSENGAGKVDADIKLARSEERKQYLKEKPEYKQCARDGRAGNKQSPTCLNMTMEANLLDKVDMDIKYDNMYPSVEKLIEVAYGHLQYVHYPNLKIKEESSMGKNQMRLKARFDRDLGYVNMSVNTQGQEVTFRDIKLNEYVKRALVVHPMTPAFVRASSKLYELDGFRPACVVDQTQVTTFNNFTYYADVSEHWTVVAQYVPKIENIVEHLKQQRENFAFLVRKNKDAKDGKDMKIVLSTPETMFRVIDITMTPSQDSQSKATIKVNEKQVQIKKTESYDVEDGFIQMYSLPNGEVLVRIGDWMAVVYDGQRVKLVNINDNFRFNTRGLCGHFNDQDNEDFLTPQKCYTGDVQKFIKSFEVEGSEGKQVRQEFEGGSDDCLNREKPLYIEVIRQKDMTINDSSEDLEDSDCTRYQTKYVQQGEQICFTTRPMPTCRKHCQAQGYITKSVSTHCIFNSNVAQIWKAQIDNGASPDFTHKSENSKIQMEVPQSCSA